MLAILQYRVEQGGLVIYVLVLCLAAAVILAAERARALLRASGPATKLTVVLASHLRQGDLGGALGTCAGTAGGSARIALAILKEALTTPERVHAAREGALLVEVPRLRARVGWFGSLANLATLIGLLGTVTGLDIGFGCPPADATSRAMMLAKAISESLTCTFGGLFVASCALALMMMIRSRLDACASTLRAEALAVANLAVAYRARLRLGDARPAVEPCGYRETGEPYDVR